MKHYEPSAPRAALASIAIAAAAITMGTLVVLPARVDSLRVDPYALAAAAVRDEAAGDGVIRRARVDVVFSVRRDGADQPAHTALGAQALRGKRHG